MHFKKIFIFFILLFATYCNSQVREPAVAGTFYPADKEELIKYINKYLSNVKMSNSDRIETSQKVIGIIVPHAGYMYSGQVAAYAFKLLEKGKIDTVILLGQSHNYPISECALYSGEAFRTPLGKVKIDNEIVSLLKESKSGLFRENNRVHIPEHSLEVEIPFLQAILSDFKIVPVLIPQCDLKKCERIGRELSMIVKIFPNKKIVFIISTDMSHYPAYETARKVDLEMLEVMKTNNPEKVKDKVTDLMSASYENLNCVLCAEEAVLAGMFTTKFLGAEEMKVLYYANSGDTEIGDKKRVVGYGACAFIKKIEVKKKEKEGEKMQEFKITEKNQKILLELARKTIVDYIRTGRRGEDYKTDDPELLKQSAVFVTLTKKGNLRGCIGTTIPQFPLCHAVQNMALSAAFDDPRFPPVTEKELKDIKIEISVLSPLKKINSPDEIKQNVHGVVVKKGMYSGLFLPQVWEHFQNKEDFLSELCSQKAGLEPNAWKDKRTELYIFTVFAFEEE